MIVSTFNIQNDFKIYNKNKSRIIYNYLKKNKIGVLGLQEVFKDCNNDLESLLYKYNIEGSFRYRLGLFHPKKNERNPIITKYKIISHKTYHLPSFKAKYNRIITKIVIKYHGHLVSVYNTHLEIGNNDIKIKQLNKIYDLISKDNNLIILMGDLNLNKDNELLIDFKNKLDKLNVSMVDIKSKTVKTSNETIDYIFVSDEFTIKKKEVIKNLDISDHYPIMIEIKMI